MTCCSQNHKSLLDECWQALPRARDERIGGGEKTNGDVAGGAIKADALTESCGLQPIAAFDNTGRHQFSAMDAHRIHHLRRGPFAGLGVGGRLGQRHDAQLQSPNLRWLGSWTRDANQF